MFCCCHEFDTSHTESELVQFHWYVSSHEKHVSTHQIFSQNPVNSRMETRELSQLNSCIHLQKSRVVACWVITCIVLWYVLLFTCTNYCSDILHPERPKIFFLFTCLYPQNVEARLARRYMYSEEKKKIYKYVLFPRLVEVMCYKGRPRRNKCFTSEL